MSVVVDTSFYDLLGVSPDADPDAIRRGYYKQARRWHPDKCKDDPTAEGKFKAVSEAYTILSDPDKRTLYDTHGAAAATSGAAAEDMSPEALRAQFEELARSLFGGGAFGTLLGDVATLGVFERMLDDMCAHREGRIEGGADADEHARAAMAMQHEEEEEERCAELAMVLVSKIKFHVRGEVAMFEEMCVTEAEYLIEAPGGDELLEICGTVYQQEGKQHLKRFFGLESFFSEVAEKGRRMGQSVMIATDIAKLAVAQKRVERREIERIKREEIGKTDSNAEEQHDATSSVDEESGDAKTTPSQEDIKDAEKIMERGLTISWRLGKYLLEERLRRVCEIALGDKSLSTEIKDARAAAVIRLGEIYSETHSRLSASKDDRPAPTESLMNAMKSQMKPNEGNRE